jgi:DNA polymerase III alpha subunit
MKRAEELGHTIYFTTEHGFGGDVLEALNLKDKYDIKVCFAMEGYIVPDPLEKDKSNHHIVLIARTDDARKKLNKINSRANKEGYYYKPRIFIDDLLKLDKNDIYITTACVNGIIANEEIYNKVFMPLVEHFGDSVFLEVQAHDEDIQKQLNQRARVIANKFNLKLIHGNDSHYIYEEQGSERLEYLKGKNMSYDDEDNFILDYPSYDVILNRYRKQGILSDDEAKEALENTLILDDCEEINIDKSIKMPTLYPDLTPNERYEKLRHLIYEKWLEEKERIPKEKHQEYIDAISFEMNIIKETNEEVHTADYFLLNYEIVKLAKEKYGGVLTKTGRGSGVSFYINRLLGFTGIDRLALEVPIYPTRFISKSRLLETRSLPDFDFNASDPEPFIKATKDLLGENGCHWMIAYGTMKESEAFRNTCRNMGMDFNAYNDVAKNMNDYINDSKWGKIIKHSQKFIDSIVSASPHPCANVIMNKDIEEELGVIKIGDKLCAPITSLEADIWKYLKNDYLTVKVVAIIAETFELIRKDIFDVPELINNLNNKVWELYEYGITATLNQTDSDFATGLVKKYKPRNYAEMSAFVAAIRPGFASMLNTFINRKEYTNGIDALDELFSTTNNFMIYQENVMQFLVWLNIKEDETYSVVKKIAKKKFTEKEIALLKSKLKKQWKDKLGSEDGFDKAWQIVEDNAGYGYNASHSISVALDSLYGAYLKANYPLEYYKVILEKYQKNTDETNKITKELSYFDISLKPSKFRYSNSTYNIDYENRTIYKSISSIKHLNEQVANELYEFKDKKYKNFIALLQDLDKVSINSRQLDILIRLNFFSEFGKSQKLLDFIPYYNYISDAKVISKKKLPELDQHDLNLESIIKSVSRETKSQYRDINNESILQEVWDRLPDNSISIKELIEAQKDYLGYVNVQLDTDKNNCMVMNINTKYKPKLTLMSLATGKKIIAKTTKRIAAEIKENDFIKVHKWDRKPSWTKDENDKWVQDKSRMEWHVKSIERIKESDL